MLKKVLLIATVFASCSAHPGRITELQNSRRYIPPNEPTGRAKSENAAFRDLERDEAVYEEYLTNLQAPSRDGQGYPYHKNKKNRGEYNGQFHDGHNQYRESYSQNRNGYEQDRVSHHNHNKGHYEVGRSVGYQNGHNSFGFRNQMYDDNKGYGMYAPQFPEYDAHNRYDNAGRNAPKGCSDVAYCEERFAGRDAMYNEELGNEPYHFDYAVTQPIDNLNFGHTEEVKRPGAILGSYHVLLPDGRMQRVEYIADENGYRPTITYNEIGGGDFSYNGPMNNFDDFDHGIGNYGGFSDMPNSGPY